MGETSKDRVWKDDTQRPAQTVLKRHFEVRKGHLTFKFCISAKARYQGTKRQNEGTNSGQSGECSEVKLKQSKDDTERASQSNSDNEEQKHDRSKAVRLHDNSGIKDRKRKRTVESCDEDSGEATVITTSNLASQEVDMSVDDHQVAESDSLIAQDNKVTSTQEEEETPPNKDEEKSGEFSVTNTDRSVFGFLESVRKNFSESDLNSSTLNQSPQKLRRITQMVRTQRLNAAAGNIATEEEQDGEVKCEKGGHGSPVTKEKNIRKVANDVSSPVQRVSRRDIKSPESRPIKSIGSKNKGSAKIIKKDIELINRYCALMPPEIGSLVKQSRPSSSVQDTKKDKASPKVDIKSKVSRERTPYYQCKKCDKVFKNVDNIRRHVAWHKKMSDTTCIKCGETFDGQESWEKHCQVHPQNKGANKMDSINQSPTAQDDSKDTCISQSKQEKIVSTVAERLKFKKRTVALPADTDKDDVSKNRDEKSITAGNADDEEEAVESDNDEEKSDESAEESKEEEEESVGDGECFRCTECGKQFKVKRSLLRHMREHTGKKLIVCSICQAHFSTQSNLSKHIKRIHKKKSVVIKQYNSHVTQFSCKLCSKLFNYKYCLDRHMTVHTKEKNYSCTKCHKTFAYKSGLQRHMRLHDGGKLYKCGVCRKVHFDKSSLKKHMECHIGEKKFCCNACGSPFRTMAGLTIHRKSQSCK